MHSGSFLYNFVLIPLVIFGGFSVMLAFVALLPGVGNFLAVVWAFVTGEWLLKKRQGEELLVSDDEPRT